MHIEQGQSGTHASNGALRLVGLSRHFGKVVAVDHLDLDIPSGQFVTLLGPSGCGKSTTLNLIAGLEYPDTGEVFLGERNITRTPPNERQMAMVFQSYALYPHMNVFDNIAFGLRLRRRPKIEIEQRVRKTAEMLGISDLLARKPAQLSGGQQQRVALGRALVKEPAVFLLDEPFSNLDAALRAQMRSEVKHLHLQLETTTVFVTHDQEEAMVLSDLLVVMRGGRIEQMGNVREIYDRPVNTYVATFVGKPRMSLIKGSLEAGAGGVVFSAPGLSLPLGAELAAAVPVGSRQVLLGLRAEDLRLKLEESTDDSVSGTVQLVEPVGSDTFVEVKLGESSVVARVAPHLTLALGQRVQVTFPATRVHLFDGRSGERIGS